MYKKKLIIACLFLLLAWNYLNPAISTKNYNLSIPTFPTKITELEKEQSITPLLNTAEKEVLNTLEIPSISFIESFPSNLTVEEGIAILEESDSIIVLAAHSGNGPLAIFTPIEFLKIGASIIWNSNTYTISNIYYTAKDNEIELSLLNSEQYLILTTCSQLQKGKQLVIIAKK